MMNDSEMAKRMAAVHRMAVTMAATDGLIGAKILSGSEFQGNPISEEELDSRNPVGKQSDGGRYFIHVRQDGRGQIMIHWPCGVQKTIKFLIPEHMLTDRFTAVPTLGEPQQAGSVEDPGITPQKSSENVECSPKSPRVVRSILMGMAVSSMILALVKFPALWPYQLARWAICAGAGWGAYHAGGWRQGLLGVLAVLYNPFQPIAFGDLWPWVNGLSAVGFIGAIQWQNDTIPIPAFLKKWFVISPVEQATDYDVWLDKVRAEVRTLERSKKDPAHLERLRGVLVLDAIGSGRILTNREKKVTFWCCRMIVTFSFVVVVYGYFLK